MTVEDDGEEDRGDDEVVEDTELPQEDTEDNNMDEA